MCACVFTNVYIYIYIYIYIYYRDLCVCMCVWVCVCVSGSEYYELSLLPALMDMYCAKSAITWQLAVV